MVIAKPPEPMDTDDRSHSNDSPSDSGDSDESDSDIADRNVPIPAPNPVLGPRPHRNIGPQPFPPGNFGPPGRRGRMIHNPLYPRGDDMFSGGGHRLGGKEGPVVVGDSARAKKTRLAGVYLYYTSLSRNIMHLSDTQISFNPCS